MREYSEQRDLLGKWNCVAARTCQNTSTHGRIYAGLCSTTQARRVAGVPCSASVHETYLQEPLLLGYAARNLSLGVRERQCSGQLQCNASGHVGACMHVQVAGLRVRPQTGPWAVV